MRDDRIFFKRLGVRQARVAKLADAPDLGLFFLAFHCVDLRAVDRSIYSVKWLISVGNLDPSLVHRRAFKVAQM